MKTASAIIVFAVAALFAASALAESRDLSSYTWDELEKMSVAEVKELLLKKGKENIPELSTKDQVLEYAKGLLPKFGNDNKIVETFNGIKDKVVESGEKLMEAIAPNTNMNDLIDSKIKTLGEVKDNILEKLGVQNEAIDANAVVDSIKQNLNLSKKDVGLEKEDKH